MEKKEYITNNIHKKIAKINVLFTIDSQMAIINSNGIFHLIEHCFIKSIEKEYKLRYNFIFSYGYTVYDHIFIQFYIGHSLEEIDYLIKVIKKICIMKFNNVFILEEEKKNIMNEIIHEKNIHENIEINKFLSNDKINYLPIGRPEILKISLKSLNLTFKEIGKNTTIFLFPDIKDNEYRIIYKYCNKKVIISNKFNKEYYKIYYIELKNKIIIALHNSLYYTTYKQVILDFLIEHFVYDKLQEASLNFKMEILNPSIKCLINSCYTILGVKAIQNNNHSLNEVISLYLSSVEIKDIIVKLDMLIQSLNLTDYNLNFIEENLKRNILYGYPLLFKESVREDLKRSIYIMMNDKISLKDICWKTNNIKIKHMKKGYSYAQ